jgi:hypothetical protein
MGLISSLFGKKEPEEQEAPYPSWVSDNDKMGEFISELKEMSKLKSIPEKFLQGVLTHEWSQNKLLFIAGLNEQQGASFETQILAVMEHVEKYWSNTDDKQMWFS